MSKILVPVDYTLNCHNAYKYALHLAESTGQDIILVHYYTSSLDPNTPLAFAGDGSIRGSYLHRLEQFALNFEEEENAAALTLLSKKLNIQYETAAVFSVSGAILKRAQQDDVELLVMATRSTSGFFDRWLGSTSITISESCNRPVFLIPPSTKYQPIKRIVVANHNETAEAYPLWQIDTLSKFTGAEVYFVHVEHPERITHKKFVPWKTMEQLHIDSDAQHTFTTLTVDNKTVSKGLVNYAESVGAHLTVVVNRIRSHWRAVLYAGVTQGVALRTSCPLLVIHTDLSWENRNSKLAVNADDISESE